MIAILKFNAREKQHYLQSQKRRLISSVSQPDSWQKQLRDFVADKTMRAGPESDVSTSSAPY